MGLIAQDTPVVPRESLRKLHLAMVYCIPRYSSLKPLTCFYPLLPRGHPWARNLQCGFRQRCSAAQLPKFLHPRSEAPQEARDRALHHTVRTDRMPPLFSAKFHFHSCLDCARQLLEPKYRLNLVNCSVRATFLLARCPVLSAWAGSSLVQSQGGTLPFCYTDGLGQPCICPHLQA